jgi:mRNA-degrading endonuclease YafQ of YafQ-DinJ toxin-antitoxin module
MKIYQTAIFERTTKKPHSNQKKLLKDAIASIAKNPTAGEQKKGDLAGVYVHKFQMVNQFTLLAYTYEEKPNNEDSILTLLSLGTHENFYRDLKK